eukprot:8668641-Pyramimonas_sp.AAC.1
MAPWVVSRCTMGLVPLVDNGMSSTHVLIAIGLYRACVVPRPASTLHEPLEYGAIDCDQHQASKLTVMIQFAVCTHMPMYMARRRKSRPLPGV